MRCGSALWCLVLLLSPQGLVPQTEFSQENAYRVVRHLVLDIGPRPMGSPAEHRALEYAVSMFRESGCDMAYIMPFDRTGRVNTSSGIAVGIKRGVSGRAILIGGHIDSAGPEVPGADDDGSGAATVMELARVFAPNTHHSTLIFCCFGGEEQGLEGSRYFAASYPDLDSIDLMLQADMANGLGLIDIDPDTHGASAPRWLVRAAIEEFTKHGFEGLRYPTHFFSLNYAFPSGSGSDHESFLARGIPAVDFTTDVEKPIHTPRDNLENFDPRGLKRTGDLYASLIRRFDPGIPGRSTDQYWLTLFGHTPIFLPLWGVWTCDGLALAVAVIALLSLRRRREPPDSPLRVRWSGIKMLLASITMAGFGWLSSDLIALIRGVRHPWLTALPLTILFALPAAAIGAWISMRLLGKLKVSRCPYALFKRAVILLGIILIPPSLFAMKLTMEPAAAILLISLGTLAVNPALKLVLTALSPWWILRTLFSEWDGLLFRTIAAAIPQRPGAWLAVNGSAILFLGILGLPFLLAFAAVLRDRHELRPLAAALKSPAALAVSVLFTIILGTTLLTVPVFDQYWYRDVHIDERFDQTRHTRAETVRSSEYLNGVEITHGGRDTSSGARTTVVDLAPAPDFDTTWLMIGREDRRRAIGDTAFHDVELRLLSKRRPLAVVVSYRDDNGALRAFDTPFQFHVVRGETRIEWYSFPDSSLTIPVSFTTVGRNEVTETIEVTYDGLADPVGVAGESIYIIPRTSYVSSAVYGR